MTEPSACSQSTTCYKACILMTYLIQLWIFKNDLMDLSFTSAILIIWSGMTFLPPSNFFAVSSGIIYAAAEILSALRHLTERSVVTVLCIRAILYMSLYRSVKFSVMSHKWNSADLRIHLIPLLWPKDKRKLQLHVIGFVFCASIERGLKIAVPLQLARITDMSGHPDIRRQILLYIGLTFLSGGTMSILKRMTLRPLLDYIDQKVKVRVFGHVMDLSRDFHDEANVMELGSLILDSPAGGELARLIVVELIPLIMDLSISIYILYLRLGPKFMQQQRASLREFRRADKHQHSVFYKAITNWPMAIYFGQIDTEKSRYTQAVWKLSMLGRQYSHWSYIRSLVSSTILCAGCTWIALRVPEDVGSTGDFILLVTYWNRLSVPLRELEELGRRITEHVSKTEDLVALLNRRSSIQDPPDAGSFSPEFLADVHLHDVSFAYPGMTMNTLQGISVSFQRGQTTAIVGESGAGKSTILKLILREYDPSKGSVKINGRKIRNTTLASLRKYIGIIPQDITFPDESILTILQYANPNASLDDIEKVCETVGLLEWIRSLRAGFGTTVGDRGSKISGGQRQRLSIAQNILKEPKILLLDEATSGVDAETKRLILEYLKESTQTKIMIHMTWMPFVMSTRS
uniref:Heavy metal tolerance protein n=1 Tax=Talaromyces marneffei PM1 TaxID=1077442 RepID=A0A093VNK6_TALMA